MRIPVPTNKLVAFTLAGALLTTVVAGGLAFPGLGLTSPGDTASAPTGTNASGQQVTADAPTPNQNFTPAVQIQSGYEKEEGEEDGEHEEGQEDGEHEEGQEDGEHQEGQEDGEHQEGQEDGEHQEGQEDGEHQEGQEDGEHQEGEE